MDHSLYLNNPTYATRGAYFLGRCISELSRAILFSFPRRGLGRLAPKVTCRVGEFLVCSRENGYGNSSVTLYFLHLVYNLSDFRSVEELQENFLNLLSRRRIHAITRKGSTCVLHVVSLQETSSRISCFGCTSVYQLLAPRQTQYSGLQVCWVTTCISFD